MKDARNTDNERAIGERFRVQDQNLNRPKRRFRARTVPVLDMSYGPPENSAHPVARSERWREMESKPLYERLGGAKGIAALVDGIVEAHMGNPVIKARFMPYQDKPDVVAKVKKHTCDFLGSASGGPEKYAGRTMSDTHRGMNISGAEYDAVANDIRETLDKHKIDSQTRDEVMHMVESLRTEIVRI